MRDTRILYYEDIGKGEEVVVFFSGILTSTNLWKSIALRLSETKRVISIDKLGFGRSPKPDRLTDYSIQDNVDYYKKTLESLNLSGQAVFVGFSSGCISLLKLIAQNQNLAKRIILIAPPFHFSKDETQKSLQKSSKPYKYFLNTPLKVFFIIFVTIFRPILRITAPFFIRDVSPESARDASLFTWKSLLKSIENIMFGQNVREDLDKIKIPIKILYAKDDNVVIKENLYKVAEEYPNISLIYVDSTHRIPYKRPDVVIKHIQES